MHYSRAHYTHNEPKVKVSSQMGKLSTKVDGIVSLKSYFTLTLLLQTMNQKIVLPTQMSQMLGFIKTLKQPVMSGDSQGGI